MPRECTTTEMGHVFRLPLTLVKGRSAYHSMQEAWLPRRWPCVNKLCTLFYLVRAIERRPIYPGDTSAPTIIPYVGHTYRRYLRGSKAGSFASCAQVIRIKCVHAVKPITIVTNIATLHSHRYYVMRLNDFALMDEPAAMRPNRVPLCPPAVAVYAPARSSRTLTSVC